MPQMRCGTGFIQEQDDNWKQEANMARVGMKLSEGIGPLISTENIDNMRMQVVKIATGPIDSGTDWEGKVIPIDASSNPVEFGLGVVGSHSSGASIASATTLTKPTGAHAILIQALTQNVRFTLDATTPTATVGFQILAGNAPILIPVPGASITVIQEAATASLQYQWVS
jgi:hypothetical protein